MFDNHTVSNQVIMSGIIDSQPSLDHTYLGENFYIVQMNVSRKSNTIDRIPLMISDRLIDPQADPRGMYMEVNGQFRSYNGVEEGHNRLMLTVFVKKVVTCSPPMPRISPVNSIYLDGFITRVPLYRRTPSGREITEMMMAVNRRHSSDYIPCICWGRNARAAEKLEVGTRVRIWGRVQSRDYRKFIMTQEGEKQINKTAYEISVGRMELPVPA